MRGFWVNLLVLSGLLLSNSPCLSTELPETVKEFVKSNNEAATIRFDGYIELEDGNSYLPVYPLNFKEVEKLEIAKTLPENLNFSDRPGLILFNNNFALLKILKDNDGNLSLINSDKIPLTVKMGLLPQDLVVPENLSVPPELKIILGDLKIPIVNKNSIENIFKANYTKTTKKSTSKHYKELEGLDNKVFYSINFQNDYLYMIAPDTGRPLKSIKLPFLASKAKITPDKRYMLICGLGADKISVIDLVRHTFVKNIKVGAKPSDIVISKDHNKAYVINKGSANISIIDLKNMQLENNIEIKGKPTNIEISANGLEIYYNDYFSGKLYKVMNTNGYPGSELGDSLHISGMKFIDNKLFMISRADNKLIVFDTLKKQIIKEINVGEKPVDLKYISDSNKLYVLSADSFKLTIIDPDTLNEISKIELKQGGFPYKINLSPDNTKALISNIDAYEIAVVDLRTNKVTGYLPVSKLVGSLNVIDWKF